MELCTKSITTLCGPTTLARRVYPSCPCHASHSHAYLANPAKDSRREGRHLCDAAPGRNLYRKRSLPSALRTAATTESSRRVRYASVNVSWGGALPIRILRRFRTEQLVSLGELSLLAASLLFPIPGGSLQPLDRQFRYYRQMVPHASRRIWAKSHNRNLRPISFCRMDLPFTARRAFFGPEVEA